jgi:hypothetical protein
MFDFVACGNFKHNTKTYKKKRHVGHQPSLVKLSIIGSFVSKGGSATLFIKNSKLTPTFNESKNKKKII